MDPSVPPPPIYIHNENAVEEARLVFEAYRWPDGKPSCPSCGSKRPIYKQTRKGVAGYYRCPQPHPHPSGELKPLIFTVRTGTVMSRSHIPLDKWLLCLSWLTTLGSPFWLPSANLLGSRIGVNRKTAASLLKDLEDLRWGDLAADPANAFLMQMMADERRAKALSSR